MAWPIWLDEEGEREAQRAMAHFEKINGMRCDWNALACRAFEIYSAYLEKQFPEETKVNKK